jgi:hypothetical protein
MIDDTFGKMVFGFEQLFGLFCLFSTNLIRCIFDKYFIHFLRGVKASPCTALPLSKKQGTVFCFLLLFLFIYVVGKTFFQTNNK